MDGVTKQIMRQDAINKVYKVHKNPVKKFEPAQAVAPANPATPNQSVNTKTETSSLTLKKELSESTEIKPDWGDHAYVWLRSYIPGWVLFLSIIGFGLLCLLIKYKKYIRKAVLGYLKED